MHIVLSYLSIVHHLGKNKGVEGLLMTWWGIFPKTYFTMGFHLGTHDMVTCLMLTFVASLMKWLPPMLNPRLMTTWMEDVNKKQALEYEHPTSRDVQGMIYGKVSIKHNPQGENAFPCKGIEWWHVARRDAIGANNIPKRRIGAWHVLRKEANGWVPYLDWFHAELEEFVWKKELPWGHYTLFKVHSTYFEACFPFEKF